MALTLRSLYRNCYSFHHITKQIKWSVAKKYPLRILSSDIYSQNNDLYNGLIEVKQLSILQRSFRQCSSQNHNTGRPPQETESKKPGLIQRFKEMYRDYWYVLLPVHMTTSAIWFGSFYYAVRSGVDVIGLLESIGISETLMAPLRDSSAGYFAFAFALYKLATPLRYAVTVGGTTYAINKLTAIGWIKPMPSRERMKEMFQVQKDNIQDRFKESRQHYQSQMKEKQNQVMEEMKRYKTEIRNIKDKVKKM